MVWGHMQGNRHEGRQTEVRRKGDIESYIDASRWQGLIWRVWRAGCSFISGLFVQDLCLLALMESADPRLISFVGSQPDNRFRLGGLRSDLFAITLCRPLRNLSAATSFSGLYQTVLHPAYAGRLT